MKRVIIAISARTQKCLTPLRPRLSALWTYRRRNSDSRKKVSGLLIVWFGDYKNILYLCSVQVEAMPATVNRTNNF